MAFFTTFYSFKGGVGRSLALANVAWLMANHPMEKARVLVLDFDLGAPGLHRVLGMAKSRKSSGLVDYVLHFLDSAESPRIDDFIHPTSHSRIDILPAGRMDGTYQRRLEKLNWREIYETAFGFDLFEKLKQDISNHPARYDYVLIDSLTGYSDVGGICVKQLPDAVVMLFRLNQQNLDGTRVVYRSLGAERNDSESSPVSVIPVITPAWPFLDKTSSDWIEKAQRIFAGKRLLQVSFDGGLSFGESIVASDSASPLLMSQIQTDYRTLTQEIRELNPNDPLTIWNSIMEEPSFVLAEATTEKYLRLLQLRPKNIDYWNFLPRAIYPFFANKTIPKKQQLTYTKILDFIKQECESGNEFSFYGRSLLADLPAKGSLKFDALADLNAAISLNSNFAEARWRRGRYLISHNKQLEGIEDIQTVFDSLTRSDPRLGRLAQDLGAAYLQVRDSAKAIAYSDQAIRFGISDGTVFMNAAKARYLAGDYVRALRYLRRIGNAYPEIGLVKLLRAQILAAMGRESAALEELISFQTEADFTAGGNLAEAYLAVDPQISLMLLTRKEKSPFAEIFPFIRFVAKTLIGDDSSKEEEVLRNRDSSPVYWDDFEVVALIAAKKRNSTITDRAADKILQMTNIFLGRSKLAGVTAP